MVKCVLCKNKGDIILADAVKCICGKYYHKGCIGRATPLPNGGYQQCCVRKPKPNNPTSSGNMSSNESTSSESNNDATLSLLDPSLQVLWQLLQPKFDHLTSKVESIESKMDNIIISIENNTARIDALEEKVEVIESKLSCDAMYNEIKDRLVREKNFIMYNAPDSIDANSTDKVFLQQLLANSNLQIPFDTENFKTVRLGKKYKEGEIRPVKISMDNAEYVHWFYHNKNRIFDDTINIKGDSTKAQQEQYKKLKAELVKRINEGETGLKIKNIKGIPTITQQVIASDQVSLAGASAEVGQEDGE